MRPRARQCRDRRRFQSRDRPVAHRSTRRCCAPCRVPIRAGVRTLRAPGRAAYAHATDRRTATRLRWRNKSDFDAATRRRRWRAQSNRARGRGNAGARCLRRTSDAICVRDSRSYPKNVASEGVCARTEHRNRNVLQYMRIPSTALAQNTERSSFSDSFITNSRRTATGKPTAAAAETAPTATATETSTETAAAPARRIHRATQIPRHCRRASPE